jgi:hypothetical protein
MFRAEVAEKCGGYPKDFTIGQDWALIMSIAQRHRIGMIGIYYTQWRRMPGTLTQSSHFRVIGASEALELIRRASILLPLDEIGRRNNYYALAISEIKLGIAFYKNHVFLKSLFWGARGIVRLGMYGLVSLFADIRQNLKRIFLR